MQLSDAVEVTQVFGASRVNELLTEGWKLLAVTTSTYGEAKEGKVLPCYILGKAAEPANSMGVVLPKRLQK